MPTTTHRASRSITTNPNPITLFLTMRKLLFIFIMMMAVTSVSMAHEIPLLGNVYNRQAVSLNGEWNYIVDVQECGYYGYRMDPLQWGFFKNAKPNRPEDLIEYDFDAAPTMTIPSDWNTRDERLFFYEGTVWFKRSFNWYPTEGHRAVLYFGAVNYEAIVYVNGEKVGRHIGGFTPFNFDVTQQLHEGENFVIVKVDNKRHADNVPTQIFDWWNYGGITRDVLLVDVAPVYVENYSLQLVSLEGRRVAFSVRLNQAEAGREVTLRIPELKIKKTVTTAADGTATVFFKAKPQLWSPETPKLYQVEIEMNGTTLRDEVGFRTISTRGKEILLNGKPIFLKGISMHEEKPYGGGRANSAEDAPNAPRLGEATGVQLRAPGPLPAQ